VYFSPLSLYLVPIIIKIIMDGKIENAGKKKKITRT
jgi:hypothetical protein